MAVPPIPQRSARGAVPRAAFFAALALGLAALAVALLVFVRPSAETQPKPVFFQIAAKDVPAPGDDPLRADRGRFFLVNLRAGEGTHGLHGFPGESGLLALSWQDPHSGCTIPWRRDYLFDARRGWFRDPCHGGHYTMAGVRVFTPSPLGMTTYAVDVRADGRVIVNTAVATPGAADNPTRVVPYLRR